MEADAAAAAEMAAKANAKAIDGDGEDADGDLTAVDHGPVFHGHAAASGEMRRCVSWAEVALPDDVA